MNIKRNTLYKFQTIDSFFKIFYYDGYKIHSWKVIYTFSGINIGPCGQEEKEELLTQLLALPENSECIKPLSHSNVNSDDILFKARLTDFLNIKSYKATFVTISYSGAGLIANYQMYSSFQNPTFSIPILDLCRDLEEFYVIKNYIKENNIKGLIRIDNESYGEVF